MWTSGELISGTQYVFEKVLGEGGQGIVVQARHRLLNRPVVIKFLKSDQSSESTLRRFFDEMQVQARMDHPNIAPVVDAGATADARPQYFFVMKLLDGVTVHALMRRRTYGIPVRSAIQIAIDVLSALECAHALGVIHRDLKPGNVFLQRVSPILTRAIVVDWGIAKLTMEIRPKTGGIAATMEWAAPEQFHERPVLQSDLYNVGLLLFFMISGQHVFQSCANRGEFVDAHLHKEPRRLASVLAIDPALDAIVHALLAKDPARRPPTARNTRERLQAILDRLESEHEEHVRVPEAKTEEMPVETLMTIMGDRSDVAALVDEVQAAPLVDDHSTDNEKAPRLRSHDPTPIVVSRPDGTTPDPSLNRALAVTAEERRAPVTPPPPSARAAPAPPQTDIHPPLARRSPYIEPPPKRDPSVAPVVRRARPESATSQRVRVFAITLATLAFAIAGLAVALKLRGDPRGTTAASALSLVTAPSPSAIPSAQATVSAVAVPPSPPPPAASHVTVRLAEPHATPSSSSTAITTAKPTALGTARRPSSGL